MKKLFLSILIVPTIVIGNSIDNLKDVALLIKAKNLGNEVYQLCILTPPISPNQIITCGILYGKYQQAEIEITLPNPVIKSLDPSPYSNSPYDICHNETGHVIFSDYIPSKAYCTIIPS